MVGDKKRRLSATNITAKIRSILKFVSRNLSCKEQPGNKRMTFKAGQSGNPNGRPKGSKNKLTQAVADRLEAMGCDPIEGMAMIAMDEGADLSLRAQMYKELAQYIAPKRKAVEMKTEGEISLVDVIRSIEQRRNQAQTAQS
jgi:hypothetical protein